MGSPFSGFLFFPGCIRVSRQQIADTSDMRSWCACVCVWSGWLFYCFCDSHCLSAHPSPLGAYVQPPIPLLSLSLFQLTSLSITFELHLLPPTYAHTRLTFGKHFLVVWRYSLRIMCKKKKEKKGPSHEPYLTFSQVPKSHRKQREDVRKWPKTSTVTFH